MPIRRSFGILSLKKPGLYYLQSRYYDPEIGRFLNADAFASTGQGILGNNMFAYCGNNPVNCSDPSGLSSSIQADIRYTYVYSPGWRGTELAQLQLSAGIGMPIENIMGWIVEQSITAICDNLAENLIDNLPSYISDTLTFLSISGSFISYWKYYDLFRFGGLDNGDAILGALMFTIVPDFLEGIPGVDAIFQVDAYILRHRPSPVEAAQNVSNHIATKGAAVSVGGFMSVIMFGQLEVRELHGIH